MKLATGIIPARYHSVRFPGKPLALINGKSMIQRVYEAACTAKNLESVVVATDDERILQAAQNFGAEVRMTSPSHRSGTDRVAEVALETQSPIIINIQGDEPLIQGEAIDELVEALQDEDIPMATLAAKEDDMNLLDDSNVVKVVFDEKSFALNFSRFPLSFPASEYFWRHIGIYGYQKDFLLKFCRIPPSRREKTEKLEQLRALENGYRIKIVESSHSPLSVDTPEDIIRIENLLKDVNR
ncbi:MAG: 3-deoxy-manno-octulosonate cytidylyltransferase [Candidatus Aminicenantes bacterium]|nr:MAG: 3-deoxy-manno-octulosonate cytidylyltransferase [Candidatus Aminicenantes bacterium]